MLADSIALDDDKDEKIAVLGNDSSHGPAIDTGTLTIVDPPDHATSHRVHDDHIHYRSIKGFSGTDTILYRVCDVGGTCGTARVTITVSAG